MFESGDVVILPPRFGEKKRGVLVKREPGDVWMVQMGTSDYAFIPEEDLEAVTRISRCWRCGNALTTLGHTECELESVKCPVCGACERRGKDN